MIPYNLNGFCMKFGLFFIFPLEISIAFIDLGHTRSNKTNSCLDSQRRDYCKPILKIINYNISVVSLYYFKLVQSHLPPVEHVI